MVAQHTQKKKQFRNYNTANCQKCLKHRSIGINKRPLVEGLSQTSLVLYQVPFQNKYYFLKSLIISSFEIIVVSYILTLQFETHKFTCSLDLDQYTCLVFLFFQILHIIVSRFIQVQHCFSNISNTLYFKR